MIIVASIMHCRHCLYIWVVIVEFHNEPMPQIIKCNAKVSRRGVSLRLAVPREYSKIKDLSQLQQNVGVPPMKGIEGTFYQAQNN